LASLIGASLCGAEAKKPESLLTALMDSTPDYGTERKLLL
jgi:hypothetical protein